MDCGQNYSATSLKVQASLPAHGRIHCSAIQRPWPSCCNLWLHIQGNASATSIVKPRDACYCSPKFQAKFHVPKADLTSQGNGLSSDSASAIAITAPDSNTLGLTERPERYFSASSFGLITSVTKFHHEDSYRGNPDQSRATTSYFQPTIPIPTPSTQDR